MSPGKQKAFLWSGVAGAVMLFGGFLTAGVFPPPSALLTPEEVHSIIANNTDSMRTGFVMAFLSAAFMMPFFAIIGVYLWRIESRELPVNTFLYLIGSGVNGAGFMFTPIYMLVATFRPERSPDLIYVLYDTGWIMTMIAFIGNQIQCFAIGLAVLGDQRTVPILPRWLGYLNLWLVLVFFPSALLVFFQGGPFAWNGLFVFGLAALNFSLWINGFLIALPPAIDREYERIRGEGRDKVEEAPLQAKAFNASSDRMEAEQTVLAKTS